MSFLLREADFDAPLFLEAFLHLFPKRERWTRKQQRQAEGLAPLDFLLGLFLDASHMKRHE